MHKLEIIPLTSSPSSFKQSTVRCLSLIFSDNDRQRKSIENWGDLGDVPLMAPKSKVQGQQPWWN